jgi:arylsulfatase A-like enzyme
LNLQKYIRAAAWILTCLMASSLLAKEMPNIVVILADDIGPGDIGFYHRERTGKTEVIPTPNLDLLISQGMRFDDAHSAAPLCAPSRFGMMTGSYSYRNYKPYGVWGPWDKTGVDSQFTTSARIAKRAGYATSFFGKSGMGGGFSELNPKKKFTGKERYKNYDLSNRAKGPRQLGFDYSFELPSGIQNAPLAYYENNAWYPIKSDSAFKLIGPKQSRYATSRKHNDWERVGDSHWDPTLAGPMLAEKAESYIQRQTSASPGQPFFLYYCAQAVHIPHTPPNELGGVKIAGSTPGLHGDMVREMDVLVGMLVKSLKKAGVYDNTLFVFTSDNGGLAADPKAEELDHDPTNGWAGRKGSIMEGGHRIPFIARWPGVITPGTRSNELVTALDVVATIAAVTGQEISRNQVMDSINLMPLLAQTLNANGHGILMHYSAKGDAALRQGDWKLHVHGKNLKNLKPKHLFNLKTNPSEDVAKDYLADPAHQERAQRMLDTFKHCLKNPTASL